MAFVGTGAQRWLGSLALLVVGACAEDELPNADPPELYDLTSAPEAIREAAKAVVRIQHPAGGAGTGSFISADGLLLTNHHVLGGEECAREGCKVALSFQHQLGTLSLPARTLFAVPQHVDVGLDMAVLQIFLDEAQEKPLASPYFLKLDPRTADELIGEHVSAVGHPLGRLKKWSSGFVVHADGEWFDSTIFSLPGGSGSPILSDEGRIVGLLHRGSEGFDLLTRTSTQVSAIGSAAAGLERALSADLPASVISLQDSLTREAALAHIDVFLAASTWTANVAGAPVSLRQLLAEDCDANLAREDYSSFEELQAGMQPCFTGLDFIECRNDVGELGGPGEPSDKLCPEDERETWRARMQAVSDKQRAFNGSLDFSAVSYAVEVLADTQDAADEIARDNLVALLDDAKPVLDFEVASYLAAYGVESYAGESTSDLFLRYAKVPYYERYAWQISISALWLYSADLLSREQALKIAKDLYRDDKVSIGAKLRIEEVLYNSDEI